MLLLSARVTAEAIPVGLDARIALWRDRMADRKVLLLLDDATGPEQVYPLLPESDRSLVLITSLLRLVALDDAVFISLDILSRQDAAGLFVRLASWPDLQPTDPAVAEIVHLCGYLPLAIRVIAGRAATHPAWSLGDLVIDLATAKSCLALLRAGNISVAAAFDLSYTGLTIRQRRLFRRLALHPGSDIDLYAAAALDGSNLATTRRHLDDLYDQHLIEEPAPGRFRFHDLIREHARALAASDQASRNETAIRRLLDYYLRTAISADRVFREISIGTCRETLAQRVAAIPDLPTYESALTWLETERLNLAVAITYAASHRQSGLAAEMSRAISPFAQRRGYWDQSLPLHQTALTAARAQADTSVQASILNDLAILHWMKGEYQVATAQLNEAQLLYAGLGNQAGLARTLSNLGVVQYLNGDLPAATTTLTQALGLCRNLGDQVQEADTLISLAEVQSDSGDPAAVAAWERSLELYSNLGSRRGQAYALVGISIMQHERAADEAGLIRALQIFRDLNDPHGQATALIDIGIIQRLRKEYAAIASWGRALAIFSELGAPLGHAKALHNLAIIKREMGDYPAATAYLTGALRVHHALGDEERQVELRDLLEEIQSESGV
jgi:tetratricopeptide (TPR) repeat protein